MTSSNSPRLRPGIGIIIPNFNGESFIVRTINITITALENFDADWEIYIVDDASQDQSTSELEKAFDNHPKVQIIKRAENGGFGEACWTGIRSNCYETVLFLNSDVLIQKDALSFFWKELIKPENSDVLAITGSYVEKNGNPAYSSLSQGLFHMGLLRIRYTDNPELRSKKSIHLFANGGFSLFNTKRFINLGGFSPIFKPFYSEDVDLAFAKDTHHCIYPKQRGFTVIQKPFVLISHLFKLKR